MCRYEPGEFYITISKAACLLGAFLVAESLCDEYEKCIRNGTGGDFYRECTICLGRGVVGVCEQSPGVAFLPVK